MIRALFFAPVLFLLVLFALSNPQSVHLGLWPTDLGTDMPVSIALMVCFAVAFLLGALLVWFALIAARLRARRAEHAVKMLQSHVDDLKAQLEAAAPKQPAEIQAPSRAAPSLSALTTN
ncbi:MAG: LapA family protein [Acetobacteraceae bacterium]|nr:LapA family protein [Acetobacteraceae bacterium]